MTNYPNKVNKSLQEYLLRAEYEKYLEDFDPSPQNYGDDYSTPPDFDTWLLEREEALVDTK